MAEGKNSSVNQLSQELKGFSKLITTLHQELAKLEKGTKDYAEKQKQLNKAVSDGAVTLGKLDKKYKSLNNSNSKHTKSIKEAKTATNQFKKAVDNSTLSVGKSSQAQKTNTQRLKTAVGTLLRYGAAYKVINGVTRLFTELTIGSAKQAINFQKSLANLSAVAGVSGERLKLLAENSELVASRTKFTAEEVVGLQTELSKLGFTSQEVIDSTQGIAFASQALNSPLNETAESIGKIINQFNLLTAESGLVSDILVTTINESALSFQSFGTAIQYVGPIARELNLSLEQTAGAMAILADNGFTASRVGTGLRGILTEIGKTSVDAEKELIRLSEANISLSEAVDLVGKRNAAQLITLLDNIEAIDDSTDKYYQQGRAAEAAAKQSNTFAGQVDLLTSAWNAFRRDLGKFVAESGIVIRAIGLISKSAEETARGFEVISGFKAGELATDLNKAAESGDAFAVGIGRMSKELGISEERLTKMVNSSRELDELDVRGTFFGDAGPDFIFGRDNTRRTEGYIKLLKQATEDTIKQNAADKGRNTANKVYGDDVERLIRLNNRNLDVNKDIDSLHKQINGAIKNRSNSLEKLTESEVLQRTEIESEITALKQLQKTLVNISSDEDKVAERRKKQIEDTKNKYSELRETAFNQKSARQFNDIIDQAYSGLPSQIALAEKELKGLVEGTAAYAKQESELDYLKGLANTIKDFKLNENDIENIVKKLYDHILLAASRENLEDFSKEFSKDVNKALEKAAEGVELAPVIIPDKQADEVFTRIDRFSLEVLKSFQDLMFTLSTEGTELANDFYSGLLATRYDNLESELNAELSLIENRYETESDILKSQLDNQLITESQFRQKQKELRKAQVAEENSLEKQRFEADKKQDRSIATSDYLAAVAQSLINEINNGVAFPQALINAAIMSGGATVAYGGQLAAINQRQFFPKKFADGGVVNGPSHDQGGVPFSVQGNSGYEMEGGEYVINKRATSMHKDLLDRINKSGMTRPQVGVRKFAMGGIVGAVTGIASVNYLEEIAENTSTSANNSNKPVRAFVTDKDLRTDSNERRLRDRNNRI